MRKLVHIVLLLLLWQNCLSQKVPKREPFQQLESLEKIVLDVEVKFNIKFSFVATVVENYRVSLPKNKYTLEEIFELIEKQTDLRIIKIDDRFYSIVPNEKIGSLVVNKLEEVIVEGFVARGINKTTEKFTVYSRKLAMLPGTIDADVLLSLQHLPGVKSPNETATGLHVRGGTADQNLVLWNGIRMYHPGHLFGMISGINSALVQSVDFYTKAVNPKYGERVSSIIEMKSPTSVSNSTEVAVGLNALNTDLDLKIPIIKDKLGVQIASRKSITEWFQSVTFKQLEDKVFQNTVLTNFDNQNQFNFQDLGSVVSYTPSKNCDISVSGIIVGNNLNYNTFRDNSVLENQSMSISNFGSSFKWLQRFSERFTQEILVYHSVYDFSYNKKQTFSATDFEAYRKLNRVVDSGLEANFKYLFSSNLDVSFGYQLTGNNVSHIFNTSTQDLGLVLSFRQAFNLSHVGYSAIHFKKETWQFHSGIRFTNFRNLGIIAEPRIFVQKSIFQNFILQLSYEERSQILSQIRENTVNDLSLENYVWAIADTENYPLQRSQQSTLGLLYMKNNWVFDFDFYQKRTRGVTVSLFEFANQNVSTVFSGEALTNGIDVLIQKKRPTWSAWITYTFQDSKNRFSGVNNNEFYPINSNIRHAISMSYFKTLNSFSFTARWFAHSGKVFSTINEETQVISFNSDNLMPYHRLDVSGSYEFLKGKRTNCKVGFSIYNVYNNRTIISKEFERRFTNFSDFIEGRYVVQDFKSLGITPNIFVRVLL